MAVAIGTDLPLIELFSPEGEKFSHSVCTSPEAERRLKNTKEGLVHHASYMEIIAFNLTLPKPFFFLIFRSQVCLKASPVSRTKSPTAKVCRRSWISVQNKKETDNNTQLQFQVLQHKNSSTSSSKGIHSHAAVSHLVAPPLCSPVFVLLLTHHQQECVPI